MKNKFEEIQKSNSQSNLHALTKKQHFIPKQSIQRFCNEHNCIKIKNLTSRNKKIVSATSRDEVFCVQRLWDQRAESGYMKKIEDAFQKLVDRIVEEKIISFNDNENKIICDMYTLWESRIFQREKFLEKETLFIQLNGIQGENLTKNEEEILEKKHGLYINENTEISNRNIIGFQIQRHIDFSLYSNIKWGIVKSISKEFIMPSNPITSEGSNKTIIFPISSQYCLIPNFNFMYEIVNDEMVDELNNLMMKHAKLFYFGKNLEKIHKK